MCKDAPAPDPLIGEAAKANAETAKEALAFYKDVYTNELIPMQKENQELARNLVNKYLETQDKQNAFADEQNAYYKETFQPVEKKMAEEAMTYDSDSNVKKRMGIAAASVNQQYSNAEQANARSLARYGMSPNSSAFALTNAKLMRDKALTAAGAQTGAAFDTQDKAIALRAGVSNFGRNMPNTAASYYSGATASGGAAMNTSTQAMQNVANNANVMGTGFNTSINGMNSAGGLAATDYNARMSQYNANNAGITDLVGMGITAGMGAMMPGAAGGWAGAASALAGRRLADGGHVKHSDGKVSGPGGPVDDKIPAMLSDGEYVIPADVVKAKGLEFFDKLKEKYHTPAAEQRMGIKRG